MLTNLGDTYTSQFCCGEGNYQQTITAHVNKLVITPYDRTSAYLRYDYFNEKLALYIISCVYYTERVRCICDWFYLTRLIPTLWRKVDANYTGRYGVISITCSVFQTLGHNSRNRKSSVEISQSEACVCGSLVKGTRSKFS